MNKNNHRLRSNISVRRCLLFCSACPTIKSGWVTENAVKMDVTRLSSTHQIVYIFFLRVIETTQANQSWNKCIQHSKEIKTIQSKQKKNKLKPVYFLRLLNLHRLWNLKVFVDTSGAKNFYHCKASCQSVYIANLDLRKRGWLFLDISKTINFYT